MIEAAMQVYLNGESRDVPASATVSALLETLGIEEPHIAVAVNRDIVRRSDYASHHLREGDLVEIVHAVGGGAAARAPVFVHSAGRRAQPARTVSKYRESLSNVPNEA